MSSEKAEAEARARLLKEMEAAIQRVNEDPPSVPWIDAAEACYAIVEARLLEASRESAALRETVARLEGERDKARELVAMTHGHNVKLKAERDALRSELVVAREALVKIAYESKYEAPRTHCGECLSMVYICDGRSDRKGIDCSGRIARRALAAPLPAATVLEVGGEMLGTPSVPAADPNVWAARGEGPCGAVSTAWVCHRDHGHTGLHSFEEVRALGRILTSTGATGGGEKP